MTSEVLCIFDIRQIQKYVFNATDGYSAAGASKMLTHLLNDAVEYAVKHIKCPLSDNEIVLSSKGSEIPYFDNKDIKIQAITNAAGNAMYLFRTKALYIEVSKKVSRYFLENAYSLEVLSACVDKTDNFTKDITELYNKLDDYKCEANLYAPFKDIPILKLEEHTGLPITKNNKSTETILREKEFFNVASNNFINFNLKKNTKDDTSVIAFAHIDGNNCGQIISEITSNSSTYKKGILNRRSISNNISNITKTSLKNTINKIIKMFKVDKKLHEFYSEFQVVAGGDDLNIICNIKYIFPFLEEYFKEINKYCIWENKSKIYPYKACAGIALCNTNINYLQAMHLAEECCSKAKLFAKKPENMRDEFALNFIEFQHFNSSYVQNIDLLRETKLTSSDGTRLVWGPYCMDDIWQRDSHSYKKLKEKCFALLKSKLPSDAVKQIIYSYYFSKVDHTVMLKSILKTYNIEFSDIFNNTIAAENGSYYATIFDALSVYHLMNYKESKEQNNG